MRQPRIYRGGGKWNCARVMQQTASLLFIDNLGRGDTPEAAYASWEAVNKPQRWPSRLLETFQRRISGQTAAHCGDCGSTKHGTGSPACNHPKFA